MIVRNVGQVRVSMEMLRDALGLREGVRVVCVVPPGAGDITSNSVRVLVEGGGLPLTPEVCEPMMIRADAVVAQFCEGK